jgi:phenylacetic acid degradation operon negative regulatory protein
VDARSALFDVYGDHLRTWPGLDRGATPVAALVRLLAPLGIRAPAVRTAVSRMLHQGWLEAVRLPSGPGYALSPRAVRRLDEAAKRIYRTTTPEGGWDGRWHVVVVLGPGGRTERGRLHASLAYLGYGCLGGSTWVAPRPAPELESTLAEAGALGSRFTAWHEDDAGSLVSRAWDLPGLAGRYERFLAEARDELAGAAVGTSEGAFAARIRLLHALRQFLNVDPGLPAALLPADWPGTTAAAWFDEQSALLLPAAQAFVASCLPAGRPHDPAPEGPLPCPRPSAQEPSCSTSRTASRPSPSPARRA